MLIIRHRVNSIQELNLIPPSQGVEIDLRFSTQGVYLQHDLKCEGDLLKDWVKHFSHELLILNVKEDGLESEVLKILDSHGVSNFFFLDQPAPSLFKAAAKGTPVAFRISDFEGAPFTIQGGSNWLWIDSFTGDWTHLERALSFAHENNLKTCLVSPELQGRTTTMETQNIKEILQKSEKQLNAVCTKNPEIWYDSPQPKKFA
jgi:hypothetical protein